MAPAPAGRLRVGFWAGKVLDLTHDLEGFPMIQALTVLFLCQLAGEAIVRLLGLAFPGPVLGMGLLFALLLLRGRIDPALGRVADTILGNLSLLFVPATVGVIQQADLVATYGLAIGMAVVVSTVLTLVVTVYTFRGVALLLERARAERGA
ncbi:MAG: CidA/LrgA family protein [Pseudomonadota bacterium]